jgi:hypothetical protein
METPAGLFALGALQMEIVKGKKGMWEKILESFACGASLASEIDLSPYG